MVNEDSSENTKDKNTAVRTTIRDLLNAPETYKSQTTDDSAKLVVNTDATVEIPDVEKISAILSRLQKLHRIFLTVLQMPFSQRQSCIHRIAIIPRQRMKSKKRWMN